MHTEQEGENAPEARGEHVHVNPNILVLAQQITKDRLAGDMISEVHEWHMVAYGT